MEETKLKALNFIKCTWEEDCVLEVFETISDDFLYESPLTNAKGFDWFVKYIETVKTGFSNIKINFRKVYADSDSAGAYYTVEAEHTGVVLGLVGTGSKIKFDVFTYLEFDEDVIRYMRSVFDLFELKKQMGVL